MSQTSSSPGAGTAEEKQRIRRVVEQRGLVGAANDTKWSRLLDAMRQREGWKPSYRCKCVDGNPSAWDAEWWYHLPLPMVSVEWLDIACIQEIRRGALVASELVDHSTWITAILDDARFCYDVVGDIIRIHGYLPKSFEGLEVNDKP